MDTFIAIDVETADDRSTICQIGLARFEGGKLVDELALLVDPEVSFAYLNIGIHGISEETVAGEKTFPEVYKEIRGWMEGQVCVAHSAYDRGAIKKTSERYGLDDINCQWLDTTRVARRTWEQCSKSGCKLNDVCDIIGYKFEHHDALEDAKASAMILLAASDKMGLSLAEWLERVELPIAKGTSNNKKKDISRSGHEGGPLNGEVVVFTGSLERAERSLAADMISKAGADVEENVNKKTTILVLGKTRDGKATGSQARAEELIHKGQKIKFWSESDFWNAVEDLPEVEIQTF